MGVFTRFPPRALARHLARYGLGALQAHEPIPDGIENSNYRVTLESEAGRTECIFTICEALQAAELGFFNALAQHLAGSGLPVAAPLAALDGETVSSFCGKPALLFPRLAGAHLQAPGPDDCAAIGGFIGELHLCLEPLRLQRDNPYTPDWLAASVQAAPVPERFQALAAETPALYARLLGEGLPTGLIHGDLFLDNALFAGGRLTGVIDFYHACNDMLAMDLAIAINDWCRAEGGIDGARRDALLEGYGAHRALAAKERELLWDVQQVAALRFALTRYQSGEPPLKDPVEMLQLMEAISQRTQ